MLQIKSYIEGFSYEQNEEYFKKNRVAMETDDRIEIGKNELFDFKVPYLKDEYYELFKLMYINHFWFDYIGQETIGRHKHYLKSKLRESARRYNMILDSAFDSNDWKELIANYMTENESESNSKSNTDTVVDSNADINSKGYMITNPDTYGDILDPKNSNGVDIQISNDNRTSNQTGENDTKTIGKSKTIGTMGIDRLTMIERLKNNTTSEFETILHEYEELFMQIILN